jgi:SWI/SNF-related matrix-associated actin-dependent regulator of chromatin subfamily A-like protein 1
MQKYPRMFKTLSLSHLEGEPVIKIRFPFNQTDLENIKTIPNRKFHKNNDCWSCPLSLSNLQKLTTFGFIPDEQLKTFYEKEKNTQPKMVIPGLKGTLRGFQEDFIRFAEQHAGNVLNSDDMGLGKTIQAIAWLQLRKELRPVLIVCPASLKINWHREIVNWMSDVSPEIISGQTPYKTTGDIIIMNYDIAHFWQKELKKRKFKVLVCDEAHALKNNSTLRTKSIKEIRKEIPHVISLTGTPIEKHPVEIFNAVSLVDKTVFPDYWKFVWDFCDPKHDGFKWNFKGAKNLDKLHKRLISTVMIRRLKSDVLKELPPKIRSYIPMPIDNRQEYRKAELDFISWVQENKGADAVMRAKRAEALTKIAALKQITVKGKLKAAIDWINDFLESHNKLVVVAVHKFVIDELRTAFPNALKIDGSVTGQKRQDAVDQFQNDPDRDLIILNLIAGGVGLTLTSACAELILELGMNCKKMDQVEDRVHRLTQTNGVNIYYGLAENTIEENNAKVLDKERKIIDSVVDGIETESSSLLYELIKNYAQ